MLAVIEGLGGGCDCSYGIRVKVRLGLGLGLWLGLGLELGFQFGYRGRDAVSDNGRDKLGNRNGGVAGLEWYRRTRCKSSTTSAHALQAV